MKPLVSQKMQLTFSLETTGQGLFLSVWYITMVTCTHVFRPVLQLPAPEKPTVVAKCCPVHFELKLKPESSLTR